jgi:chorismate mutase/prephenate dehydratase
VIDRLQKANPGPLGKSEISCIFREVMSACRALEHRLRVAFLGPQGTFSEQAVWAHFGHSIDAVAVDCIDEVFRRVEAGQCEFGVVPVENSTEGSVSYTLDALLNTSLKISGEVSLTIVHHLLAAQEARVATVREVCAHPQALAQCKGWLQSNLPGVTMRAVSSNAEGARLAGQDATLAAIAGQAARDHYGLQALAEGIQDNVHNRTRFLVIGAADSAASGRDLTSVVLAVANRPGAVYRMLEPLDRHGVSMTRFESRPARNGRWEYYFYIDMLGHRTDPAVAAVLQELQDNALFFRHLGSFPSL